MYNSGLKARNFQNRSEPIRLFNISNFPSIVEDELAVLQRRTAVELPAETRIYILLASGFYFFKISNCITIFIQVIDILVCFISFIFNILDNPTSIVHR